MAKIQVDQRGGYRKKYQPWPIVEGMLATSGEMTQADLFRGYKDAVKAAYAAEWASFNNIQPGTRRAKRPQKPPKGCTYHSFVCYMRKWLLDGLIAKVIDPATGQPKRDSFQYANPGQRLEPPTFYQLAGGTIPVSTPAPAEEENWLETLKQQMTDVMDEENKAASIRKLETIIARIELDKLDKIDVSDIEDAINDYRAAARDEKSDAFDDILSAIDALESEEEE